MNEFRELLRARAGRQGHPGGGRYAADLGFSPHPDFRRAWPLLEEVDVAACAGAIPLGGEDGEPLFIAGPRDDVDHIMATLTRRLGPDGFHFIAPLAL